MVAEAVKAPEAEVTPPEEAVAQTPEAALEAPPPTEDTEADAELDAVLAEIGIGDAAESVADGTGAASDGTGAAAEAKPATEEEIRQKVEAENKQRQDAAALQSYRTGIVNNVRNVETELTAKAKEWGLDIDQAEWLKQRFLQHNGNWNVLYEAALEQARPELEGSAHQRAEGAVARHLLDGVKEALGEPAFKALQIKMPWTEVAGAIAKEARKGYVPEADRAKAVKDFAKKIDAALKERGSSLAEVTGNGGINRHSMTNGGGGHIPTMAAWSRMKLEEREAYRKRDPDIEAKIR